jgi:hypothetical protein
MMIDRRKWKYEKKYEYALMFFSCTTDGKYTTLGLETEL